MSETTVICPNCNKAISSSAFALHEVHCQRNYQRCSCGQLVKKSELSAHLQTRHALQACPNCAQTMERFNLDVHRCEKPLRKCGFCEAEIRFDDYSEHVAVCGSRTRPCPTCRSLLRLRDYEAHRAAGKCIPPSSIINRPESAPQRPRRPTAPAPSRFQGESSIFSGPHIKGPFRLDGSEDRPLPPQPVNTDLTDPTEDELLAQAIAMSLTDDMRTATRFPAQSQQPQPPMSSEFDEDELQEAIRESMKYR